MQTNPSTRTHLTTAECWALLEGARIGRLAIAGPDGTPDIFPVNFVVYEGSVYIRTAPDVKLVRLTTHPRTAFEVDGHGETGWWSVVVHGDATRVRDQVEIERSGVTRLVTASPRYKQHVLKIGARTITGRQFMDRATQDPPAAVSGAFARTSSGRAAPADPSPRGSSRAARPEPIPSRQPDLRSATTEQDT